MVSKRVGLTNIVLFMCSGGILHYLFSSKEYKDTIRHKEEKLRQQRELKEAKLRQQKELEEEKQRQHKELEEAEIIRSETTRYQEECAPLMIHARNICKRWTGTNCEEAENYIEMARIYGIRRGQVKHPEKFCKKWKNMTVCPWWSYRYPSTDLEILEDFRRKLTTFYVMKNNYDISIDKDRYPNVYE